MSRVLVDGDTICVPRGSQVLVVGLSKKAKPASKMPGARVYDEDDIVCFERLEADLIIRTGEGWGRRGRDYYYYYNNADGKITRLAKKHLKKLHTHEWLTCLKYPYKREPPFICLEMDKGVVRVAGIFKRNG